jgi:hypothetical protein
VHGFVELLEELLVFFLAAFGGEAQGINFLDADFSTCVRRRSQQQSEHSHG